MAELSILLVLGRSFSSVMDAVNIKFNLQSFSLLNFCSRSEMLMRKWVNLQKLH